MSPELFDPKRFNLKDTRRTKRSDCYALGMVIYEVLSGKVPFFQYCGYVIFAKVLEGERPGRPQGAWFTDDIWSTSELCWNPEPDGRPSVEYVLRCLEEASRFWIPPQVTADSLTTDSPMRNSSDSSNESTDESEVPSPCQAVPPLQPHRDLMGVRTVR